MKIVEKSWINFDGYSAIYLFGYLHVKSGRVLTPQMLNHEYIHDAQAKELLYIFFYIWYCLEFIVRYVCSGFKWKKSYYAISFEREAYSNQDNAEYLSTRRHYKWLSYL